MGERELPEGWVWKRLGDCCQTVRGIAFPSNSKIDHFQEGFVACLRTANVQAEVEVDDLWFIPEQFVKNEQQIVKKFDILISSANSLNLVGKVALVKKLEYKTTLGAFISLLRSNSTIDPKYLYYYLSSNEFKRFIPFIASTTTNISNISMTRLAAFRMVVPPLPVQHQIVAVLEQAEAVKRQRQAANALTGALLQSVFFEMFGDPVTNEKGWPLKNIKEFSAPNKNAIKAGPFGSSLKKECYTKTGFKIYGQEQVIKDDLQFGDYYISQEKYQELINYSVQAGDILISLVGSYGKISIVPESFEQGIINPRLMKISLNQEHVLPIFFKQLFLTEGILNQIEELSHGGTMDIINVGIVKQLKFLVPPLALQQQFARVVESVERIHERQVASGRQIEGLCEGLMQRAFSGELVINEA